MTVQLWAFLGLLGLICAGAALRGFLDRAAGRNEAKLKAAEGTIERVAEAKDVADGVGRLTDAESLAKLRQDWHR